ncbi:YCF48-related protein [Emticicia sp. BO119]|uniref:WD40/YVTN/BNR-like repeat-containing protein n=1 Tax=Emticicia sp. BO119 TaxID=2757768 RepID=UPI0015F0DD9D|nr:YCF48-related protein [Emticicia sp. BO119]MBA4850285.1 hypothetical protein [Emticicia sp. BO119]
MKIYIWNCLLFLCFYETNAQVFLTASQTNSCSGNSIEILLNNPYPVAYPNGKLLKNGIEVAHTNDGQLSYTTSEAGEYEFVYDEKEDFRQLYWGYYPSFTFQDMTFLDLQNGIAIGNKIVLKTEDKGQTWNLATTPTQTFNHTAVHFSDASNGWVVGFNGQVIKTTDGGNNWVNKNITGVSPFTPPLTDVFGINSTTAWAVGDRNTKVFKTTNGGDTWTDVFTGTFNSSGFRTVFFLNQNEGWIAGDYGIIRKTTNGGVNWTSLVLGSSSSSGSNTWVTDIFFIDSLNGWFIGEDGLISRTSDGGATWTKQRNGSGLNGYGIVNKIRFPDALNGFATISGELYKTTDGGSTWVAMRTSDGRIWANATSFHFFSSDDYLTSYDVELFKYIKKLPRRTNSIIISTKPIITANSTNICPNQTVQLTINPSPNQISTQWLRNNQLIAGANGLAYNPLQTGNYKVQTITENKFFQQQSTFPTDSFRAEDLSFVNSNSGWVLKGGPAGNIPLFKTIDGGMSFNQLNVNSSISYTFLNVVYFQNTTTGWLAGYDQNVGNFIAKTTDGGNTWIKKKTAINATLRKVYFLDNLKGWAIGYNCYQGCGYPGQINEAYVLRTVDGGESWTPQRSQHLNIELSDVYFVNELTGWVVGVYGLGSSSLLKTTDGGVTWTEQLRHTDGYQNLFFLNDQIGWFNTKLYRFKTTNGGISWSQLPIQYNEEVAGPIYFKDTQNGVSLGKDGIFKTVDGGQNWIKEAPFSLSDGVSLLKLLTNDTTSFVIDKVSGQVYQLNKSAFLCESAPVLIGNDCCSSLVVLTNPTDNVMAGSRTTQASAINGIIHASNHITGTANVIYQAKSIELNPNFRADPGTVFKAETGGCN